MRSRDRPSHRRRPGGQRRAGPRRRELEGQPAVARDAVRYAGGCRHRRRGHGGRAGCAPGRRGAAAGGAAAPIERFHFGEIGRARGAGLRRQGIRGRAALAFRLRKRGAAPARGDARQRLGRARRLRRAPRLATRRLHLPGTDHQRILGPGPHHPSRRAPADRARHRLARRRRRGRHPAGAEESCAALHAGGGAPPAGRLQGTLGARARGPTGTGCWASTSSARTGSSRRSGPGARESNRAGSG